MTTHWLAAAVLLCTAEALTGASYSVGLRSFQEARRVLDAGVTAMGGAEALSEVRTVRRQLQGGWTSAFQQPRPYPAEGPSLTMPPTLFDDELTSVVDYAGRRSFESLHESNHSGDRITQVDVVTETAGFDSLAYFDEKPILRAFDPSELPSLLAEKLRRYPEGVLKMALDRPETLQWVGAGDLHGRAQRVVSFADPAGARILLYFDADSGLLSKSEWLREQAVVGDTYAEVLYLDYRPVGKLLLPFRYVDRVAGLAFSDLHATAIETNVELPAERLRAPGESVAAEPDPAERTVEPLGGDVYLLRGSYNTIFAGFDDFVVVLEAPLSSAYSEAAIETIRKTLPGKPIRYLVATHFHPDHIGGVRPFIAAGVTILTTPDARGAIERVAASPRALHPDALSRAPRPALIEVVASGRVLEDAHHRLELHDVGPSEHVAQILVAYFPRERLLFEADLLDVGSKELVLSGPDGVTLAGAIRRLGLRVERIIPVHGSPATSQHLDRALAVRAKHVRSGTP